MVVYHLFGGPSVKVDDICERTARYELLVQSLSCLLQRLRIKEF